MENVKYTDDTLSYCLKTNIIQCQHRRVETFKETQTDRTKPIEETCYYEENKKMRKWGKTV